MYKYFLIFALLIGGTACGQWTEPDTTACPQPGPGAECPWISNDNLRLYMSNMAELYVFTRPSPDSAWGPRTLLPAHIISTPTQRCPAESPTGDTLYFVGDPRADCENYGSWDVYFTVRTGTCDTCWGLVQNAGANVSSNRREYSVGISRDGSTLLVSSTRGGFIEPKLWWHEKQTDGTWGSANYFPPEINDLENGEEHACLSPDNNRLFYWHHSVMLGDIWVSEKVNGVWQQGVPLPSPPNNWPPDMAATADADPCLAMDGCTLWLRKTFNYYGYDYHIAVSIDTSGLAADLPARSAVISHKPAMSVTTDTSGALRLNVSGAVVRGEQEVEIYDILGRLIGKHKVRFIVNGTQNFGVLPDLSLASGTYVISLRLSISTLSAMYHIVD